MGVEPEYQQGYMAIRCCRCANLLQIDFDKKQGNTIYIFPCKTCTVKFSKKKLKEIIDEIDIEN